MSRPIPPSDAPRGTPSVPPTEGTPLPPRDLPPGDPPPRRGAGTLVWLLLLIALLAFGWYFYNQRGAVSPPVEPATPVGIGSDQEAAAERERAAAEARDARPATSTPAPAAALADRDPQPLAAIAPAYPPAAFRAREEGVVVIRAAIDAQGVPSAVEVASSSRSRDLDRAAVDAVGAARFAPAIRRGQATSETVQVPVEFRLDQP